MNECRAGVGRATLTSLSYSLTHQAVPHISLNQAWLPAWLGQGALRQRVQAVPAL